MKKGFVLLIMLFFFQSLVTAQTIHPAIKLEFFKSIPAEIDGCSGTYTYDSISLKKERYIFITNGNGLGMIHVNGKIISLKMVSTKELSKTSWKQVFKGEGYTLTLTTKVTKRLDEEDIFESGTLEIIKGSDKVIIKIHGESGC
jgi:hypothetical protein